MGPACQRDVLERGWTATSVRVHVMELEHPGLRAPVSALIDERAPALIPLPCLAFYVHRDMSGAGDRCDRTLGVFPAPGGPCAKPLVLQVIDKQRKGQAYDFV